MPTRPKTPLLFPRVLQEMARWWLIARLTRLVAWLSPAVSDEPSTAAASSPKPQPSNFAVAGEAKLVPPPAVEHEVTPGQPPRPRAARKVISPLHMGHCCPLHGCAYADEDCVVFVGHAEPYFPANNACQICAEKAAGPIQ